MSEATEQPGDEAPSEAPPARRRRSPIIDVFAVILGGAVLWWMLGDVRYFFRGSEPRDLGDASALVARGLDAEDYSEQFVVLRGTPDVQHAARVRLDDKTIGYLRIIEGGGSLFAAIPRTTEAAPNQFEGTFTGRMRRLADSPNFPALQQHFDGERIVEDFDARVDDLIAALGARRGADLSVKDNAGRSIHLGSKDNVTLVVAQPDVQLQLGRSSFADEAAAEVAVAALGAPYFKPAEQNSGLFFSFYARIAPDARAAASAQLAAAAAVPSDAGPADPRVGAVLIPWSSSLFVPTSSLALADGKLSVVPADNARTGFVVQDGKLVPRPLQDGRVLLDAASVRAVRLERPVAVDPKGYIIEVGVRPGDRLLELGLALLVLCVVGWNLASLVLWWRARRA